MVTVVRVLVLLVLSWSTAFAADPVRIPSGVQYELIGRWDADKLNHILTVDTPPSRASP